LGDQLRAAMASRAIIEQAKGIIMVRSRTDADGAFEILRRASQRQNVKSRDVARQIVDGAQRPPSSTT
jgi:AmiR/NasT family two-component response regulator